MNLTLIRNATLRLELAGQTVLIDPMLGDPHSLPSFAGVSPNPTVPLPVPAQDVLRGVTLLVVSHLHPDHLDPAAIPALPKDLPVLCQPGDEATLRGHGFRDVTPLQDTVSVAGLTFTRTDGEHGSGEILAQMGAAMGFVLRAPGEPTLYWAGDTVLIPAVTDTITRERPDVIVTHSGGAALGGTLLIMDATQTVDVLRAAPDATVVAVHLESLDHCFSTRADLRHAAQQAGVEARLRVPQDGEALTLV
ncbi:MBL fold metallo-hydrolase [Deinococcus sp. 6GRE01]|uniref:MBL fold metallo-hydrolase n=1 Tax=Deinococcus sp. 6GRE01 TaxID=2745873 RepID=UPI001E38DFF3|nr:MBL fold metallo-hydrolase [Deinococcus sp. 6GRE01]MCD0157951.1 MBL fold metallo-hydrolase [Deinococcus sp. 6GRE01]